MFLEIFEDLSSMYEELDEDQEMVNPLQIASLLVDWTDPQKVV